MSERYQRLVSLLQNAEHVAVAFSGGVDSTLVAAAALDAGIDTVAITVVSPVFAEWQRRQAIDAADDIGIRQVVVETDVLPPRGGNRCYHCKQEMARLWQTTAARHGFRVVADGVTTADLADPSMPGARAASEAGIWHPLADLELSEAAIRELAQHRGLSVWNAPSDACLATRLPLDEPVTMENLRMVEAAERVLREITAQVRVRMHGDLARIEVPPDFCDRVLEHRETITARLQALGIRHVTLDLQGLRHGSMHDTR